jgi:hypothetical protein
MSWSAVLNPVRAAVCTHPHRVYYHGLLGYEAMVCTLCGDHARVGIDAPVIIEPVEEETK